MSDKILAWVFGIGSILSMVNVYLSYKGGNLDALLAWIAAVCFAFSALGAYLKLIYNKEDEEV